MQLSGRCQYIVKSLSLRSESRIYETMIVIALLQGGQLGQERFPGSHPHEA
jgi:hypothetical protein